MVVGGRLCALFPVVIRVLAPVCLHLHLAVGGRPELGRVQPVGVLYPQVRPERVDPAVGRRTVRANGPLRGVRVEVVPSVGNLLAAGAAPPGRAGLAGRRKHVVIRHLVVQRVMTAVVPGQTTVDAVATGAAAARTVRGCRHDQTRRRENAPGQMVLILSSSPRPVDVVRVVRVREVALVVAGITQRRHVARQHAAHVLRVEVHWHGREVWR